MQKISKFAGYILAFIFLCLWIKGCESQSTVTPFFFDINEFEKSRNSLNQEISKRQIIETELLQLKNQTTAKDERIKELQREITKNTEQITYFKNNTKEKIVVREVQRTDTLTINQIDTFNVKSGIYKAFYKNKWLEAKFNVWEDSLSLDYTVFNEFITKIENKGSDSYFLIKNLNPNTTTTDFMTFKLPKKRSYKGLWLLGGFITGIITYSILK